MIAKYLLFSLLWMLTGNPIVAIILVLVLYYVIDRRYFGMLPSVVKPFRQQMRTSNLKRVLNANPHDMPAQYELAQLYIERRKFADALTLLEALPGSMQDTADVLYDTGLCYMALGRIEMGEQRVLDALRMDGRLRYGEPYLKLATAVAASHPKRAMEYLREFQTLNFSSCEGYYRMGELHKKFGNTSAAVQAWEQCIQTYRVLPKFRKRVERHWVSLARIKLLTGGR